MKSVIAQPLHPGRTNRLRGCRSRFAGALLAVSIGGGVASVHAAPAPSVLLYSSAQVDGEGVFLPHLLAGHPTNPPPHLRVCEAPAFGQVLWLTRDQIAAFVLKTAPEWTPPLYAGAERVRIVRRARMLAGDELLQQLTQLLQRDQVQDRGELELRLVRPWVQVPVPDEPYTLTMINLPSAGVTPHFIAQFELATAREVIGKWQVPLQARVWREVMVARTALKLREPLTAEAVMRERRDVLGMYDTPLEWPEDPTAFELAETVPAGSPLYGRSVRLRPVVHRGQVVEAQLRDGMMTISVPVEVLENGAPGQMVRVRNLQSRREFRGKVEDEQTVLVAL